MRPELRLVEYFLAVAQSGNVTRAAERLHISQPSLSAAVRQLESQVGVELLERRGRSISLTPAGRLLASRGRSLLDSADAIFAEVRDHAEAVTGRVRLGASPTARYRALPLLLDACADHAPRVMIYTSEDTTGALLRDVAHGTLDAAVTFCAPPHTRGVVLHELYEERAVVHLPDTHPLASRETLSLTDLRDETILISDGPDSSGYTKQVMDAFESVGIEPETAIDPHPDLGLQAVREGMGLVVYVRGAFPGEVQGSVFVELVPALPMPFHLATRAGPSGALMRALGEAAVSVSRAWPPADDPGRPAPPGG